MSEARGKHHPDPEADQALADVRQRLPIMKHALRVMKDPMYVASGTAGFYLLVAYLRSL